MRIFLSYRRADVGGHVGRLADALEQRLGPKQVFHDVTAIDAGRDFLSVIHDALDGCDAALAVIGPGWLTASTPEGKPRLFEPDDYVRLELATVLSRGVTVAPVMVGGAALPTAADLPEELRPLLQRQAIVLRDETWHQDVERLVRSLSGEPVTHRPSRRRVKVALAIVVIAALAAITWWRPWDGGPAKDESSTSTVAPACPDPTGSEWTALPLAQNATAQVQLNSGPTVFTARDARWRLLQPGRWQLIVEVSLENRTSGDVRHQDFVYESVIVGQREFTQSCFETQREILTSGTVGVGRSGYVVECEPGGRVDLILGDPARTRMRVTEAPEPSPC